MVTLVMKSAVPLLELTSDEHATRLLGDVWFAVCQESKHTA